MLTLDLNHHKMSVDASTVMEEIINPGGKTYKVRRKGLNPLALQNIETVGLEMMDMMDVFGTRQRGEQRKQQE